MRCLVTGSTGFIGGHLVRALAGRGEEVTALVRSPHKATDFEALGIRMVRGDLDDPAALGEACRDQEVVYHLAGVVKAAREETFFAVNERGTRNVVEAAGGGPKRPHLVLVSSMAAAGPAEPGQPLRGDEPTRPVTAYGRSKLAGEAAVRESSLPWTIVRPPMVYGPGDVEFLPVFRMAHRGFGAVFGSGGQELSAVFAPDLVDALVAVGGKSEGLGGVYYACHPERFTSRDFVEAVGRSVGRRSLKIIPLHAAFTRVLGGLVGSLAAMFGRATMLNADKVNEFLAPAWTGDPSPLTRDTGWHAAHDLRAGLERTVGWYLRHGWI